jgi:transcriptional regulator with XRE-family HTH domain
MSRLGELLQRLMEEKDVTAAQLGSAAGISESTVQQILRGEIVAPPERRLRGFARVLGVSLSRLQEAVPEEERERSVEDAHEEEEHHDASALGDLLQRLMEEKDVTATQLGSAAGISESTVQQILRGEIVAPPERRLRGFARVLGVSLSRLQAAVPEEERERSVEDAAFGSDGGGGARSDGWVQRYDRAGPLMSPTLRADGSLLMTGRAARPGVLIYRNRDGTTRRELVLAEDLHRPAALGTLGRAPVTLEHPVQDGLPVEVTPHNVQEFGVGDVDGEVHVEQDGFVTVRLAVRRHDAIDAINAGKHELSPGYKVRVEETAGIHPQHGPFDAIQRDRRYNHLAVVDRARGGASVRLRTDGAAYQVRQDSSSPQEGSVNPLLLALLPLLGITTRFDSEEPAWAALRQAIVKLQQERTDGVQASVDLGAVNEE